MDGGEEVTRGFVVAGRDGPILLEFGEEVLDQVTRFINMPIEVAGRLPAGFQRY
jgi:hypothetical protein